MADTVSVSIADNVADTLFIPLYMRCLETRRADRVINDPMSCELVERLDYDFSRYEKSPRSQLGVAVRIRRFDQAVADFIETHDDPVVVSVGAGLDTRFQRVYKGKGVFYELDLPEVIELRRQLLPESENNPYMAGSMFETGWIDEIKGKHPGASFIVVAEGVFLYFEEHEIKPLITAIAERFGHGEMHFDVSSPWGVRNSQRHETVKKTNAAFKWGVKGDRDLEAWTPSLRYMDTTDYFSSVKSRWGIMGLLARWFIPGLRNAFRMLHYEMVPQA
jgi:O-methyltransferase involved in polyketide biosynthesis